MAAQGIRRKTTIVCPDVFSTSSMNQVRLGVSEVVLVSPKMTEISQSAFFSDQLLFLVLESGDALFGLFRQSASSQHDGDPMVVATVTDE